MSTKPAIILCADDFGISEGVNRAILDLCEKSRLSAVTCMTGGAAWEAGAPLLKRCKVAVGLHVTLTYLPPLVKALGARHPSEKKLIVKSWLRLLDRDLVEQEIRAQFKRFTDVWGAPPDFIDGHQHVHVLPVVRDIVLRLRDEYAPAAWVRNVAGAMDNGKSAVLTVLGWRFRAMLKARGIPTNALMRGSYDLRDFPSAMRRWSALPALVYCHPGFPDADLAKVDGLLEPRRAEYDFLNGDTFGAWLDTRLTLAGRP